MLAKHLALDYLQNHSFPMRIICPLCTQPFMEIFEDGWWKSHWFCCASCKFHGDGWSLLKALRPKDSWKDIQFWAAVQEMLPAGLMESSQIDTVWRLYHKAIPKACQGLSHGFKRGCLSPDDLKVWMQLFGVLSRSCCQQILTDFLQHHLLVGTPAEWRNMLNELLAEMDCRKPMDWPAFRALLRPVKTANSVLDINHRSLTLWYGVPCCDLPGRIVGWWIVDLVNGLSEYYLPIDKTAPEGCAGISAFYPSKLPLLFLDNLLLYILWQCFAYYQTGKTLPLVAYRDPQYCPLAAVRSGVLWSESINRSAILMGLSYPKILLSRACNSFAVHHNQFSLKTLANLIRTDAVHAYKHVVTKAEPVSDRLSREFTIRSPALSVAFLKVCNLRNSQLENLAALLSPPAAQLVRDYMAEQASQDSHIEFEGKLVRQTAAGWLVAERNGHLSLITDTAIHIETIIHCPLKKQTRYRGYLRHMPSRVKIAFEEDRKTVETQTVRWMENLLLDNGLPLPQIDRRWSSRLVRIALRFFPPRTLLDVVTVGWSPKDSSFLLPTGSIRLHGSIEIAGTPLPASAQSLPGKIPIITDPSQFSLFTVACLSAEGDTNSALWAILASLLRYIIQPAQLAAPADYNGTYFTDSRLAPLVEICSKALDCPQIPLQKSPLGLSKQITAHHWPSVSLHQPSHAKWFFDWCTNSTCINSLWRIPRLWQPILASLGWCGIKAPHQLQPISDERISDLSKFLSYYLFRLAYRSFDLFHSPSDKPLTQLILRDLQSELGRFGLPVRALEQATHLLVDPEYDQLGTDWLVVIRKSLKQLCRFDDQGMWRLDIDKQQLVSGLRRTLKVDLSPAAIRCIWNHTGWQFSENHQRWSVWVPKTEFCFRLMLKRSS